jgi:hypothetical protein
LGSEPISEEFFKLYQFVENIGMKVYLFNAFIIWWGVVVVYFLAYIYYEETIDDFVRMLGFVSRWGFISFFMSCIFIIPLLNAMRLIILNEGYSQFVVIEVLLNLPCLDYWIVTFCGIFLASTICNIRQWYLPPKD